ncbi:MAG: glycoside hydrolase family 13 protein [Clostridium sp.]|nr:glycoside hydrolase family 13 protein [Clostridium sp.]
MEHFFAFHNSHVIQYREPFGAVPVGTKVIIKLLVDRGAEVFLNILYFDDSKKVVKMSWEGDSGNRTLFSAKIDTTNHVGIIRYYFSINKNERVFYYGNNTECLGGEGCLFDNNPATYQITVYQESYIPEWFKEGIIYQIFPDRFFNGNSNNQVRCGKKNSFIYSNWYDDPMYIKDSSGKISRWDFYGGNLRGVIEKLHYLKELGVSIIYFNPIFQSASCHRYDVGDYEKIDEMLGDEEDFKELCVKAKDEGIRVILDGVFSHTGSDSKYFNKFGNYPGMGAYQSKDSIYYSWYRFGTDSNKYECWWGFDNQPNVEELNPSYLNYIVTGENSIVEKWLRLGASGWRLDVADELPDKFIELLKYKMREVNKESVLIGEVWEDASNKVSYSEKRQYLFGKELDSVTNYPLRDIIIRYVKGEIGAEYFTNKINSLFENYPINNFYSTMNILGSHDTYRILTVFNKDIKLLELAVFIQMTLPGVPLVYYGDEAGLLGEGDPTNRRTYPWGKENKDIFEMYKKLIHLRKDNEVLSKGSFNISYIEESVVCIRRCYKDKEVIIILNNAEQEKNIKIEKYKNKKILDLLSNEILVEYKESEYQININRRGYRFLELIK